MQVVLAFWHQMQPKKKKIMINGRSLKNPLPSLSFHENLK